MAKTLAELRKQYQELNNKENNSSSSPKNSAMKEWLTLDEGSNIVRFLPGKDDPFSFVAEGAIHRYEIPSEPYARNYKCRRVSGEKCPVCDFYFDLWKRHKELDMPKGQKSKFGDLATKIKQKPRFYSVVVSRALQEAGENPVRLVGMSKQLFDRVMKYMLSEDFIEDGEETIISLERGNDFDINMDKSSGWPNFTNSEAKYKKTPAGKKAEIAEWMEHTLDPFSHAAPDTYEKGVEIVQALEATLNTVRTESEPPFEADGDLEV